MHLSRFALALPILLAACSTGMPGDGERAPSAREPSPEVLDSDILEDDARIQAVFAGTDTMAKQSGYDESALVLQQALYDLDLLGDVDGYFGSGTQGAVQDFQDSVGVPDDGVVGSETLGLLDDAHGAFASRRFWRQDVWHEVREGQVIMTRGESDTEAVLTLQATLYSLGYDLGSWWIDGDYGGMTHMAVSTFQADHGLAVTGNVDSATLAALDVAARDQLESLQAAAPAEGSLYQRYELWADIATRGTSDADAAGLDDDAPMVLWVIDLETNQPVAGYLTSPGKAGHETVGDAFTVLRTMPRAWWYPGESYAGSDPEPPGLDNPMGILKLHFVEHLQAIHGTPKSVWSALGTPASSGCLRVSGINILDLHERWAESGTMTIITRDPADSVDLQQRAAAAGVVVADIEQGREWVGAYVGAERGRDQWYTSSAGLSSRPDPDEFRD